MAQRERAMRLRNWWAKVSKKKQLLFWKKVTKKLGADIDS
jgi:hypothetical protein